MQKLRQAHICISTIQRAVASAAPYTGINMKLLIAARWCMFNVVLDNI